ncbi:alpha-L-rhamnosidase C-terminal domain-containing protein [Amycolatopsis sp. NPDC051045]|uniref:alpha-L-rhamnosidase C-terminal domain-containing protein n=1 Tax=Amycolatopsis sp. NPDC051045 TaxID=3156922 RepID=UPI003430E8A3
MLSTRRRLSFRIAGGPVRPLVIGKSPGPLCERAPATSGGSRSGDAAQRASRWSEPAWFETAFLAPGQFRGDWIGAPAASTPPPFDGASWIWHPEGNPADSAPAGTRYFRRAFELPAGEQLTAARLDLTADDSDLTNASAHVDSPLGRVSSAWTREHGRFTLRTGVPAGATAEVLRSRPGRPRRAGAAGGQVRGSAQRLRGLPRRLRRPRVPLRAVRVVRPTRVL